jgi:hypothetical protein
MHAYSLLSVGLYALKPFNVQHHEDDEDDDEDEDSDELQISDGEGNVLKVSSGVLQVRITVLQIMTACVSSSGHGDYSPRLAIVTVAVCCCCCCCCSPGFVLAMVVVPVDFRNKNGVQMNTRIRATSAVCNFGSNRAGCVVTKICLWAVLVDAQ